MKKNMLWFIAVVVLGFVVLSGRFAFIQIGEAEMLQQEVVEQRVKQLELEPERGKILDVNGNVLAMSLNMKDVAAYPNLIKKEETRIKVAREVSDILGVDEAEILEKLSTVGENGKYAQWVRLAKRIDPETANRLNESSISAFLEVTNTPKRSYLNNTLASNIIGFVNDEGQPGGGLELSLNNYIAGTKGITVTEFDHMGNPIPIGISSHSEPIAGNDVVLTIDSYIQHVVEEELERAAEEFNADQIHAILMKPNTGEITAMATYPSFDPNNYQSYDKNTYNNHPASFVYEPGSTFKPIYMAMALETGKIDENSTFFDGAGHIVINGHSIKNWDRKPLGTVTPEQIIVNSSNVGMVQVSQQLEAKEIYEGLKKAGFGVRRGIELPNEEYGLFPDEQKLKTDPLVKATEAFGHGIAVTPLQLVTGIAEIANGGYKIKPHLIKEVKNPNGELVLQTDNNKNERLYSEKTAEIIKGYMKANSESGSGRNAQIEGYDSGSKTGTTTKLENGVYVNNKIIGSYVSFIPYNNPEYVMLILVDNPDPEFRFGSTTGVPIFKNIMEEVMRYKQIDHTIENNGEEESENEIEEMKKINTEWEIPNYELFLKETAITELQTKMNNEIELKTEGDGFVVADQHYSLKNDRLIITLIMSQVYENGKYRIPNLSNKTKSEIEEMFAEAPINITFFGDGKVFDQSVDPGIYSKKINEIIFWLK